MDRRRNSLNMYTVNAEIWLTTEQYLWLCMVGANRYQEDITDNGFGSSAVVRVARNLNRIRDE
jgi:hypothetical protein